MSSTPRLSRRRLLFGVDDAMLPAPVPQRASLHHGKVEIAASVAAMGRVAFIDAARCLNTQGVVCASCADACPHRAIVIPIRQRAAIHVQAELCDGCAECVSVCPGKAVALHPLSLEPA